MKIPKETLEFFNGEKIRARVFLDKYALRDKRDRILEKTPREMWRRVANAIASTEMQFEKWSKEFYWLLEDFKFIPGGRIHYGAGNNYVKNSLLNCYFIKIEDDSIEGIFDAMKYQARTYSYGGGVGIDISCLRPRGAKVKNSARYSTGAASFMDIFSQVTGTIGQYNRRGALLLSIDCQHPDVEEFITAKSDPERRNVRFANISVKVRDAFMEAVENDDYWHLWYPEMTDIKYSEDAIEVEDIYECFDHPEETFFHVKGEDFIRVKKVYKTVKARDLWNLIVKTAWESAEPGLLYWDTIIRYSNSEFCHKLRGTNPCGEIPLPHGGCCCLGHINLAKIVENPYENPRINWKLLERLVRLGVRFLDDVLTYNAGKHPIPIQNKVSAAERRIGLGITGLADFLMRMKIRYDSEEALKLIDKVMDFIKNTAYKESAMIAKEKGPFPKFNMKKMLDNEFIKNLRDDTIELIKKYGLRNVAILTVAPVGTGSILAGTTSGIEPLFAKKYLRRSESLSEKKFVVRDPAIRQLVEKYGDNLPEYVVSAYEIDPVMRVRMQAVVQKHVDNSISSTVNLPRDFPTEKLSELYFLGWKLGLKGLTVYREGSREGVLHVAEDDSIHKNVEVATKPQIQQIKR